MKKTKMIKNYLFSYSWILDDSEKESTTIRLYGLSRQNESICLRINDFTPYLYVELPPSINWDQNIQHLSFSIDRLMGRIKPVSKKLVYKKHLYGYTLVDNQISTYPYLLCVFSSKFDIKSFEYRMKSPIEIQGLGKYLLKIHETHADPILQMVCCRKISTAGWIQFRGTQVQPDNKVTTCLEEYIVPWKNLSPAPEVDIICSPKILAFDIEVNSTNPAVMPDAKKPGDKIFQISCVIMDKNIITNHLLSLGNPDQLKTGEDVIIHSYSTESDLLEGFSVCIRDWNPHIITGYNILGFDFPYMVKRAKLNMCLSSFDLLSMSDTLHSPEKKIKWSSAAFGHQEYEFLDAEGRVIIDLLPIIRRDYKLSSYSLKSVSSNFLEETKDDLSPNGIFKCYRLGMKGGQKGNEALGVCGKYCVKDSSLVIKLMDKLNIWAGLCEFANTCNVSIFSHYTQGQEKKVYSQIYLYAMHNNIVVEKDKYICKDSERYVGAHVFDPVPGVYENVIPFDFCSLYPSIMIAYNIDYSTFVEDPLIPDELCHVMNFEDHVNCKHDPKIIRKLELTEIINEGNEFIKKLRNQKKTSKIHKTENNYIDNQIKKIKLELAPRLKERASILITNKNVMCEKRNYRFIKEPKGVLPTIIQNLLDARAHTRSIISKNNKIISSDIDPCKKKDLEQLNIILDKRQLAYKVGCNSMYGIMAIRNGGSIPFMPGAMCTTYMGRINIQKTADVLKSKYNAEFVYGDTDSNYVMFPNIFQKNELWDTAIRIADELSALFPPPMKLEFEKIIYTRFMILTKKRYMYRYCYREGIESNCVGKKGVLLARRDTCQFIKNIYEKIVTMIFDGENYRCIVMTVIKFCIEMLHGKFPSSDFVITKAVGCTGNMNLQKIVDDKGKTKGMMGDYTVPLLPSTKEEYQNQLIKKNVTTEKDYYLKCLPAQVQLADKIRKRGQRVDVGTRLEYVILESSSHKQYEKIESFSYFKKYKSVLNLDYLYYLKLMIIPVDQIFNSIFSSTKKDIFLSFYNHVKNRKKVIESINKINKPILQFN